MPVSLRPCPSCRKRLIDDKERVCPDCLNVDPFEPTIRIDPNTPTIQTPAQPQQQGGWLSPKPFPWQRFWRNLGLAVTLTSALLFATNPSRADYLSWIKGEFIREAQLSRPRNGFDALGNAMAVGLIDSSLEAGTVRRDFLVCSLYRTDISGRSIITLGGLKGFHVLFNIEDSPNPTPLQTPNGPVTAPR